MADTSVGAVSIDIVIKDTIDRQMQAMANKAQSTAQAAFTRAGQRAGDGMGKAMSSGFDKSVALAQAKVKELERSFEHTTDKMDAIWQKGIMRDDDKGTFNKLAEQQEKTTAQLEAARDKLAVYVQAAAEKQAAAEAKAYAKTQAAAEQTAAKQMEAAGQGNMPNAPSQGGEQMIGQYGNGNLLGGAKDKLASLSELLTGSMAGATASEEMLALASETTFGKIAAAAAKGFGVVKTVGGTAFSAVRKIGSGALNVLHAGLKGIASIGQKAFSAVTAKVKQMTTHLRGAGGGLQSFGSRLKSIVGGALIFNGISAALRGMTSYMSTAVQATGTAKTALANLKGAAATAAAPIIQLLAPALATLANMAATVFSYISKLISMLTGKSVSAMAGAAKGMGGVGSAAGSTAKQVEKAAKSLAGFDEIQKLAAPEEKADTGGGGGGGAGAEALNYDFKGKSPFLDSILDAIKAGDWYQVGRLVGEKLRDSLNAIPWPDIQEKARTWATNLATMLNGFVETPGMWEAIGNTLAQGLNTATTFIDTFFQTFHWESLGAGLANGLQSLQDTVDWATLGRTLTDGLKASLETLHGFVTTYTGWADLGNDMATATMAAFNNVDWAQGAADLSAAASGLFETLTAWVQGIDWGQLGTTVYECLVAVDWGTLVSNFFEFIGSLLYGLFEFFTALLEPIFLNIGDWVGSHFTGIGENGIQGFLDGMWSLLCDIGNWIKTHMIDPLVNGVKDMLGIHSPSTVFAEIGRYLVQGLHDGIASIWGTITAFFAEKLGSIKQNVLNVWDEIQIKTSEAWRAVGDTIGNVWNGGIVPTIKGAVNSIIGFMNNLLTGAAGMINGMVDLLNKFKIDVPENVPLIGGTQFGFSLDHVAAPQIPMLANGGVIGQPTLAMMGEYAGAASNPEIAAPQSLLRETMAGANEEVVSALLQVAQQIIDAIKENGGDTVIGDEVIGRAYERYSSRRTMMLGGTL